MGGIIYAGDCHCSTAAITKLDQIASENSAEIIVQCGDLGIFWPSVYGQMRDFFEARARSTVDCVPFYFVDGNHDNHDALQEIRDAAGAAPVVEVAPKCFHVARGTKISLGGVVHLFCGGARSTDRGPGQAFLQGHRIWWPQEVPSEEEFQRFATQMQTGVEVVVTHESPVRVPHSRYGRDTDLTARSLDGALRTSDPRPVRWYYGHHHKLSTWEDGEGTTFYNCGLHGQCWLHDGSSSQAFSKIV